MIIKNMVSRILLNAVVVQHSGYEFCLFATPLLKIPLLFQAYLGVELSIHTDSPPFVFVLARVLPGVELGPYVDIF